ncbi:Uncharacterised protein [Vibrio cholerae]|nr:Uncharacterised protein [Vibrio cholerae]
MRAAFEPPSIDDDEVNHSCPPYTLQGERYKSVRYKKPL